TSAEGVLKAFGPWMQRAPRAFQALLAALDDARQEPLDIVIAGRKDDAATQELLAQVHQRFLPGRVLSLVEADPALPLPAAGTTWTGPPAAYVWRTHTCAARGTGVEALAALL